MDANLCFFPSSMAPLGIYGFRVTGSCFTPARLTCRAAILPHAPLATATFTSAFRIYASRGRPRPEIDGFVDGVFSDLQNLAAILSKLRFLFESAKQISSDPSDMVVTDLEIVFLTCRSTFDLLQEILVRLWENVTLNDTNAKKEHLKKSYADMVTCDLKPRTAESIVERFGLPPTIADIYAKSEPFFAWLRDYRNSIEHSGHTPDYVFMHPKGFAISRNRKPFSDMDIWCDSNTLPNGLGSALSAVAQIVNTTFSTCDAFAAEMSKIIKFPPPIAPNLRVFVRGPHIRNLVSLQGCISKSPWYEAQEGTGGGVDMPPCA